MARPGWASPEPDIRPARWPHLSRSEGLQDGARPRLTDYAFRNKRLEQSPGPLKLFHPDIPLCKVLVCHIAPTLYRMEMPATPAPMASRRRILCVARAMRSTPLLDDTRRDRHRQDQARGGLHAADLHRWRTHRRLRRSAPLSRQAVADPKATSYRPVIVLFTLKAAEWFDDGEPEATWMVAAALGYTGPHPM